VCSKPSTAEKSKKQRCDSIFFLCKEEEEEEEEEKRSSLQDGS
jgi:hypothetical protein